MSYATGYKDGLKCCPLLNPRGYRVSSNEGTKGDNKPYPFKARRDGGLKGKGDKKRF